MRILDENELNSYKDDYLTISKLRKFIEDTKDLSDDSLVMIERVEDYYYDNGNWGSYLKENMHTDHLKDIKKRIESGEYKGNGFDIPVTDEEIQNSMSQYHPAFCIGHDNKLVYIHLHY